MTSGAGNGNAQRGLSHVESPERVKNICGTEFKSHRSVANYSVPNRLNRTVK
ncbi:hypothetical protein CFter6_2165 [Collimonas fungivorans]|uniref:Uncharacterized protein n=1 Tax=Collimonas fungivorans TaxID=158899 RepID=A0A127PAT7_9BURK|nr:hypothetical protein CFter6_2165 [Collimonas fungivorans]